MSFDWAELKATVRRTVDETFGVQAFYSDASVNSVEFRVRPHTKTSKPFGGLVDGDGYAETIEGVDRIVCIPVSLYGATMTLTIGGEITVPCLFPGVTFVLDYKIPADGPLEETWQVTRK